MVLELVIPELVIAGGVAAVQHGGLKKGVKHIKYKVRMGSVFVGNLLQNLAYANIPDWIESNRDVSGSISAQKLKEIITHGNNMTVEHLRKPTTVSVTGTFFTGSLLTFGWWEPFSARSVTNNLMFKDDGGLQHWLFGGFEQWAPSWDLSREDHLSSIPLVGQIGTNDEADSIPVIVKSKEVANDIRSKMGNNLVIRARVIGVLCTLSQLKHKIPEKMYKVISRLFSSSHYVILVENADDHDIKPLRERHVDYYSGYIWKCIAPAEVIKSDAVTAEIDCGYFVWEHTNFAKRDVINYSMDSMYRKRDYIEKRIAGTPWRKTKLSGKTVLLQHLMTDSKLRNEKVEEEIPEISAIKFYDQLKEALA